MHQQDAEAEAEGKQDRRRSKVSCPPPQLCTSLGLWVPPLEVSQIFPIFFLKVGEDTAIPCELFLCPGPAPGQVSWEGFSISPL